MGAVLNLSSIANECDITVKTVSVWLSALETSYIIFRLPAYHKNPNKRHVKSPKLYFFDTGLASALMGIGRYEQLTKHKCRGALFENAVICEYMKQNFAEGKSDRFFFWRTSSNEVGLIIERGGNILQAIEIKPSSTYKSSYFDGLAAFAKDAQLDTTQTKVIYAGADNIQTSKGEAISIFR